IDAAVGPQGQIPAGRPDGFHLERSRACHGGQPWPRAPSSDMFAIRTPRARRLLSTDPSILATAGEREGETLAGDEPIIAEEELALADDERLPWLESDDDYEEPAVDTGRIVAFAGGSLLVLALIVGGIWWATTRDAPSG